MTSFSKTTGDIDNGWDVLKTAFCDSRNVFFGLIGLIGNLEIGNQIEPPEPWPEAPEII